MERLIVKKLYSEKKTHLGGVAEFGYVHLPNHSELYITKKVKQRFRLFNIPFYVTTSVDMVDVPVEIASLFANSELVEDKVMVDGVEMTDKSLVLDLVAYKHRAKHIASEARLQVRKNIKQSKELTDEQKQTMLANLKADEAYTDILFSELSKNEEKLFSTFLHQQYKLVYRKDAGTTQMFYFAKIAYDRIMFYKVDAMKVGLNLLLADVKSFYITDKYISVFLEKIKEKGGI